MKNKTNAIGAIGEHMVAAQLMLHGWDALNANFSITNMAGIDLVCLNSDKKVALIQVKTTARRGGFPTGLTLGQAKDRQCIEEHVLGPWVFVRIEGEGPDATFSYYILSRQQVIDMIDESNTWYLSLPRQKLVDEKNVCVIQENWLKGEDYVSKQLGGTPGKNPLNGNSAKDKWENIW